MFQFVFDTRLFRFSAEAPTRKPLLQVPPTNQDTGQRQTPKPLKIQEHGTPTLLTDTLKYFSIQF